MARNRSLERGFSLIEIVLVMALAAILLGIAIPSFSNRDVLGSTARLLVADAARARSYSVRIWEQVTLDVDVDNSAWRVVRENGAWVDGPGADENGWRQLDPGVTFETVNEVPPDTVFLPNGRTAEDSQLRIRSGNSTWLFTIQALTGRVSAAPEI
jgi:prepilin-type N-terminal cleavage/methylation domain-containing protein